jgi:hypothetical protein
MDEALMKRVLPHSVEAEQSVIGSMLMDKDAIIAASEIIKQIYRQQLLLADNCLNLLFLRTAHIDRLDLHAEAMLTKNSMHLDRILIRRQILFCYLRKHGKQIFPVSFFQGGYCPKLLVCPDDPAVFIG